MPPSPPLCHCLERNLELCVCSCLTREELWPRFFCYWACRRKIVPKLHLKFRETGWDRERGGSIDMWQSGNENLGWTEEARERQVGF